MQLNLCQVKAGGIRPSGAVGSLNFSNATIFSFHSGESHEAIELVYCLSVCVPRDLHGATHTLKQSLRGSSSLSPSCLCAQGPSWGNTYGPQSQVLRRSLSGQQIKAALAGQGLPQRAGYNGAGEGAGWSQVEDQFAASLSMGHAEEGWQVGRGGGGEGGTDGGAGRPLAGLRAASGDHHAARR